MIEYLSTTTSYCHTFCHNLQWIHSVLMKADRNESWSAWLFFYWLLINLQCMCMCMFQLWFLLNPIIFCYYIIAIESSDKIWHNWPDFITAYSFYHCRFYQFRLILFTELHCVCLGFFKLYNSHKKALVSLHRSWKCSWIFMRFCVMWHLAWWRYVIPNPIPLLIWFQRI